MSFLADTAALVEDVEAAAALYELLLPWGDFVAVDPSESFRGSLQRDLGVLAATLARWDVAAGHFDAALRANEQMGLKPWLARTQENYARMLRARDEPGDVQRAKLLESATAIGDRV
jgi:hypothetical protein